VPSWKLSYQEGFIVSIEIFKDVPLGLKIYLMGLKIYLRDSGLFHSLMSVSTFEQLRGHHKLGASWEGFALECVARTLSKEDQSLYFWHTHAGAELDLFWQHGGKNWGVEFKYADAPRLTKSMKAAMDDLHLERLWVIYPGNEVYKLSENIAVMPLETLADTWNYGTVD
jgi:predicted AAA+ superfamily ATPase